MSRDNLLKGRVSLAYHAYHVTICTHNRALLFADFTDGRLVVAEMRKLHEEGIVNSLAWVIMPDHLHWLFQLGEKMTLSEAMKHFKARSAQALNRHHGQHGVIWQKGYYDHALRCEEDIQAVARYIVANPLRAGLVKKMGEYPLWDAIWIRGEWANGRINSPLRDYLPVLRPLGHVFFLAAHIMIRRFGVAGHWVLPLNCG